MGTQGFWSADLEATVERMLATLVQFSTTAARPAASAATEGMFHVATDSPFAMSYDNGGTWVEIGSIEATKSDMEDQGTTNADRDVSPEVAKNAPSAAKVWVKWEQTDAHSIQASYNMTSVTDGGAAGDTDHLWNIDFSGTEYALVSGIELSTIPKGTWPIYPLATTGVTTNTGQLSNGSLVDEDNNILVGYGDQ